MEIVITGRQMRITETLKKYIEERVQRTAKYLSKPAHIAFILKAEKYRQIVEAHLTVDGLILKAEEETEEMQASVDQAMMKIDRQLKKYKEKVSSHRTRSAGPKGLLPPTKKKSTVRVSAAPSRIRKVSGEIPLAVRNNAGRVVPNLLDRETVLMEVLTLEEALVEMKSKGKVFFFFRDRASRQCQCLHKNGDGQLGLIELRDKA